MKIGFDVSQTCAERAGCGWYADSLIRALVDTAPEHQYFLYHQFGSWINPDTNGGTRIKSPSVTPTFLDVSPQEAARIWGSPAEMVIKTGAPDIVHANSFRTVRIPGAKLVFTVYDVSFWAVPEFTTEDNRLACQEGMLKALGEADGFIFISQSTKDEFERMLPGWLERSRKPWAVTLLGPRYKNNKPSPTAKSAQYWLAVGSLEPRKNYDTLLDALEIYWAKSHRRLPLKIAGGSGWKSDSLKQRIETMQARGLLTYLGYVPDEDLSNLYLGAEALIFPSWYEGFGLPVLEALTLGCPVICSNRTSLPEAGGKAAYYVDPSNPQEIADHMLKFDSVKFERQSRIQSSLRQADRFSWTQSAKQTLRLYERVLDTKL